MKHTDAHSLSLSLSHTHTHTHTCVFSSGRLSLTRSFDSVARFTRGVSLAEVLIPVESGLALTDRVHGSVARARDPLVVRARVAQQTVRDVVPELGEQPRAARHTLGPVGARAVVAHAEPRGTAVAQQRLSGHRVLAPVRATIRSQSRHNRQHQQREKQLERGRNTRE